MQACVLLLMPYLFIFFRSRLWGTISNAFEKSMMIISSWDLLFRDLDRSCVVSINWVSAECFCRSHVVCQIQMSVGQEGPLC